jgi:hypothetical protein
MMGQQTDIKKNKLKIRFIAFIYENKFARIQIVCIHIG